MTSMRVAAVISGMVVASCGRVGFDDVAHGDASGGPRDGTDGSVAGVLPIHEYTLNNTLADTYGGPTLAAAGGQLSATGYTFDTNQGLTLDNAMPPSVYTLDIQFSLADITNWKKIVDFDLLASDTGLYVYEGATQIVIIPTMDFLTSAATIATNVPVRLTVTRDASGHVIVYKDRAPMAADRAATGGPPTAPTGVFEYDDTVNAMSLTSTTVEFFIDDNATSGGEAGPGKVTHISIYDVPLTAAQVAALP